MDDAVRTLTLPMVSALALLVAACSATAAQPSAAPIEAPAAEVVIQADLIAALQSEGATVELGEPIALA
jgi:hypothetical protein